MRGFVHTELESEGNSFTFRKIGLKRRGGLSSGRSFGLVVRRTPSFLQRGAGRDRDPRRWGKREIIYPTLQRNHQSDSALRRAGAEATLTFHEL